MDQLAEPVLLVGGLNAYNSWGSSHADVQIRLIEKFLTSSGAKAAYIP